MEGILEKFGIVPNRLKLYEIAGFSPRLNKIFIPTGMFKTRFSGKSALLATLWAVSTSLPPIYM